VAILATASALASTGAVDQYTEQPPTNPAGDGNNLSTGGTTAAPTAAPGGSPSSSAPGASSAGATTAAGSSAAGATPAERLGIEDWPWRAIAAGAIAALTGPDPSHSPAPTGGSPGADEPSLPLVDYPMTPLILALMASALAGAALAGGLGAYRRFRGAA
jgi:hypothetical protein